MRAIRRCPTIIDRVADGVVEQFAAHPQHSSTMMQRALRTVVNLFFPGLCRDEEKIYATSRPIIETINLPAGQIELPGPQRVSSKWRAT